MDKETFRPEIITDVTSVEKIKEEKAPIYVDAFAFQLKELFFIKHTEFAQMDEEEAFASGAYKSFVESQDFVHVYYPWNNHLVKTVPKDDFLSLKTNRNQDLITKEEQDILINKHVAVFGLSVGSNIVTVLTQAGVANTVTIADFDLLDTTNLNRILAGVHQIGLNKAVVSARGVYEGNPFAEVHVYTEGLTQENLPKILDSGIDLVIEEVDALPIKMQTRILAEQKKLPVLMVTDNGDGVVLHVERYDLGHDKIFGKEKEHWLELMQKGKPSKEEVAKLIVENIVGGPEKVDPRMMKSVERVIKHELLSWPQLGSAAVLAGVVATVFAKRILLGQNDQKDIRQTIFVPESDLETHD